MLPELAALPAGAGSRQVFRSLKSLSLCARAIFHWRDKRLRAYFFACMLAYYLEWHIRRNLKPLMFAQESPPRQHNPAAPVARSRDIRRKQVTRRNRKSLPVHGFRDLLEHLGTLCATEIDTGAGFAGSVLTQPTPLQERTFSLLGLKPHPAPEPRNSETQPL